MNEVKRQAVAELQRAVAAAESRACEVVATERAKMEKMLLEARKQAYWILRNTFQAKKVFNFT